MSNQTTPNGTTSFTAVVGAVLASLRKSKANLNQSDMASAIGATVSTWSRIETGETAMTIEQLTLAAEKLDVPPSEVLIAAEKMVLELRSKGIETEAIRVSKKDIITSGRIPIYGGTLLGLVATAPFLGAMTAPLMIASTAALWKAFKKENNNQP